MSDPAPATDIDPNAWYHITEQNVDHDYKTDWKSILQINQDPKVKDTNLHVWPAKTNKGNVTGYWQFQPVSPTPGQYMLRYSQTGADKQLSVCLHSDTDDADTRSRPCLLDATSDETQQWDVGEWKSNNTYRLVNVHNGTKYNMDCMSNGPVFMSPDVDDRPYQSAQHWLMTSASSVDDQAYSTTVSEPSSTKSEQSSASTTDSGSSSSSGSGLSSGAIAGISVGVVLGVLALALAAFFVWRSRKRKNAVTSASSGSPTKTNNGQTDEGSPAPPYQAHSPDDVGKPHGPVEMMDSSPAVVELPVNPRFELP